MRALLITQPGPAWLAPFVVLATALEDAGHDVAFGSAPSFLPTIEQAGFEAYPVGLDWLQADPVAAFPETATMDEATLDRFFRLEVLPGVAAAATFGDLTPLARTWQADLLVHDASELGTPLAAEATRLPHATIGLTPVPPPGALAPEVRGRLEAIRVDLGLLPDPQLTRLWPALLTSYPASFEAEPIPARSRVRPDAASSADLTRRPIRPLVADGVATPAAGDGHRVLVAVPTGGRTAAIADALWEALGDQADLHLIAASGGPQGISVAEAEAADLMIGLGAPGPTMAALLAGVPQVVIATGATASDLLAHRVAAAGAGQRVSAAHGSPDAIKQAATALVEEPLFRANAQRLRRELLAQPGVDETVQHLVITSSGL